ncbi:MULTISPECIES: hypothetical protein [Deinococcus]|uniref:Uncharacterized protein n=1 Tax=Deinococcus rufus TaxID=2136097 RepID=A0ABV7Z578_9DEIO|nr:hypothetical protein [Deinococcus sp. AB2017081]WQE96609.1 hypothetical protein U2P90_06835 [Deinococcus sp. AB2017081]
MNDQAQPSEDSAGTAPAPARIWGLVASEADRVVLFRRGPSRWTRLYVWDAATDVLTPGSWFRGRLYEWMCDLSPDGEHLLYTARNETPEQVSDAYSKFGVNMYSWTALSVPPQVRALGLWNASDGWSGGGVFDGNRKIMVNHADLKTQQLIHPKAFTVKSVEGKHRVDTVLISLNRTRWRVTHKPERWLGMGEAHPFTFQKRSLELRFISAHNYKRYVRYRWLADGPAPDLEGVTWADLDRRGRLLIARAGRLFIWEDGQEAELANLNDDQPPRPGRAGVD